MCSMCQSETTSTSQIVYHKAKEIMCFVCALFIFYAYFILFYISRYICVLTVINIQLQRVCNPYCIIKGIIFINYLIKDDRSSLLWKKIHLMLTLRVKSCKNCHFWFFLIRGIFKKKTSIWTETTSEIWGYVKFTNS